LANFKTNDSVTAFGHFSFVFEVSERLAFEVPALEMEHAQVLLELISLLANISHLRFMFSFVRGQPSSMLALVN
jgi:hypothetical protein